jgi:ribosomal protein S18 acetylase RimI-like enzyme
MLPSPDNQPIEYGTYTAPDEDDMVRLLGQVFSRHDPPAVAVGLEPSEFESFVRLFCPKAAAEGLTIVARLAGTGELVGALLTEDGASDPPGGMDRLSKKFEPIFDILGQLDAEYRSKQALRPGESLHLFLLGVAESVAGRGVAQKLVENCLMHGASRGYRLAVTEATNKVSQHVFRKHGFVERVQRSYGTHYFDGRIVFASIAEQGGPILMDKQLS